MARESSRTVTPLSESDGDRLRAQREVVEKYIADDDGRKKYAGPAGKLGLIRAILRGHVFEPDEKYQLQCLGIVFGDALVQDLGMEWVMVEDEFGRDPAVRLPGTSIILHTLTMISKRVERGEYVDAFDLFNWACAKVDELRRSGR